MHSRTSNRGRALLVFLIVLAAFIITLFYGGGGGIIDGAQRIALAVAAPAQRAVAAVVDPFAQVSRYSVRLSSVTTDNRDLRAENSDLKKELKLLARHASENRRLRLLAGFRDDFSLETAAAVILSRSPTSWQSIATIDAGSRDGIKKRRSVVTDKGLVGQVVGVTGGTAVVQMVDDRRSGVAVEVSRTGATGIVEGRLNGSLRLRFIADDADIKKGDRVVTSGVGGVHPRGIVVGTVEHIDETAYSLEKEIRLKAAVDYRRLSEVLVIMEGSGE